MKYTEVSQFVHFPFVKREIGSLVVMYKCIQLLYYILDSFNLADLMLMLLLDNDTDESLLDCREYTTRFSNFTGLTGKTLPVYETMNIASLVSHHIC